ncbi:MAG: hypothetical protein ACXIVQ_17300 [Acidimicrobiales bacterium]
MSPSRPATRKAPARATASRRAREPGESFRTSRLATSRFGIVYDIDGPRVRLGVVWFVAALAACAVGVAALAVLVGAVAALGAAQTAKALRTRWRRPDIATAAIIAGLVPVAAAVGTALAGVVLLVGTVAAVVVSASRARGSDPVIEAGAIMRSSAFIGLAAASIVILYRIDIGAAVTVILMISAYEVGDYLVGSGSGNVVEGPASGMLAIVLVTAALAVFPPPPFLGVGLWVYAGFAAVGAPIGQVLASAVLPRAGASAPALRRLDSYLVVGPVWMTLLWAGVGT